MSERPKRAILLGLALAMTVALLLAGPVPEASVARVYADRRTLLGIPNALDVLSNLPFLAVGLYGLWTLAGSRGEPHFAQPADARPYRLFFVAVTLVAPASSFYHLERGLLRLGLDRLPIALAFMALFAGFLADRVDRRLGLELALPAGLVFAAAGVAYWLWTESLGRGDLRLYILAQFGPMLLLPALCLFYPKGRLTSGRHLALMLGLYLLAKGAEVSDAEIFALSGETIGGHSLKHLLAALAAFLVLDMVRRGTVKTP